MWEQNNSRLQIKPTDKSSTTLAEVKSLVLLPKSWHQNSTKNFTSDRLKPAEMCGTWHLQLVGGKHLCVAQAWDGSAGCLTHHAGSSPDGVQSNSCAAGTEALQQERAPSPCCPSSDAGLSCWNAASRAHTQGEGVWLSTLIHMYTQAKSKHVSQHYCAQSQSKQVFHSVHDGWMGGGQACLQHFLATLTPE